MSNIIRADLYRIVRDKAFIILIIIACIMAFLYPAFSGALSAITKLEIANPYGLTVSALQPFSNFGLLCAIFIMIIINKDYSSGTVRNKVIMGKSRGEIFLAEFVVTLILVLSLILSYAALTFIFSCVTLGKYIAIEHIETFFIAIGLEILGWVTITCFIVFFLKAFKGLGGAIVVYVAIGLLLVAAGSIFTLITALSSKDPVASNVYHFFQNINVIHGMTTLIPSQVSPIYSALTDPSSMAFAGFDPEFLLEYIFSAVVFSSGALALGYVIFNKRDLK